MKRRDILSISVMTALGLALLPSSAVAQPKALKDQLVGTWTLVSAVNIGPDGTKLDPYRGQATGVLMFDGTGHFSWQIIRSDIPKLASNNRNEGTADEFKAVAQGVLSYFGTYSLDDSGKTLTIHIENSSFPNFSGTNQKRSMALTGDELTLINQAGASGATAEAKWKHVK